MNIYRTLFLKISNTYFFHDKNSFVLGHKEECHIFKGKIVVEVTVLEHLCSMPKVLVSIPIIKKKQLSLSGMMFHSCNFSNGEKEADRSGVQD